MSAAADFDLAAVQRRRDAELATGRRIVAERADDLAGKVIGWADRAHRAQTRLSADDAEAAAAVTSWCRRRLKLEARRVLGRDAPGSVRADVADLCSEAMADRLRALDAARIDGDSP